MTLVSDLRTGLANRLATITGLRSHDQVPDSLTPPSGVVGPPSKVEYDKTFGRGADKYVFPVRVLAQKTDGRAAQTALDAYLSSSGATSVKAAIEGDCTLGGKAHDLRVVSCQSYGSYQVGGVDYIGAEWTVEVWARG